MLPNKYFQYKKKNIQLIKISLIKPVIKPGIILPYSLQIKNNHKSNSIISKEINLRDVLKNMLTRTNKLYENLDCNQIDIKLDNEQFSKRAKIIKYIKDFIEINITFKKAVKNKNIIFCEVIFLFDLLIIQNKKCKCMTPLEKLGLGALILILKFNKLHDKNFIKKYKSIFNNKYMTLDEINKIEVLSLKIINYDITLPNHMYYIDILYKNIFLAINNKEKNIDSIYKQIISITKYIMTFSNNYIKFHPFYFSSFIIKFCLEQNKIEEFHYKFMNIFEINMRDYRILYEEFLKTFQEQINIGNSLYKEKEENIPKRGLNKSLINNKSSGMDITEDSNINKYASITATNGFSHRNGNSIGGKRINSNNNSKMKIGMNSMNNTYYKKFLENYLVENININENNHKIISIEGNLNNPCKIIPIPNRNNHNNNFSLQSPKNCGISIDYRIKKKFENKNVNNNNDNKNKKENIILNYNKKKEEEVKIKTRKNINISMDRNIKSREQKENINNENEEKIKDDKSRKIKRFNSELTQPKIYYRAKGDSIRKIYKSKNKEKNLMKNLIDNKKEEINDTNNIKVTNEKIENIEKKERITVNILNKKSRYNITSNLNKYNNENNNNINFDNNIKKNVDDDLNFRSIRSTVNQSESSSINMKDDYKKRFRKMNIRNFYKNKNSIILKF